MDYRDFKAVKDGTPEARREAELPSTYWWAHSDETLGGKVVDMGESLKNDSQERSRANLRHARLYENVELNNLTTADMARTAVRQSLLSSGLVSLNVVAAAIDTLAAKISKNKPRPMFVTSGASWKMQRAVRKLDKWCRGVFYETKVHQVAQQVFLDACIFGTGLMQVFFGHDDRLCVERVMPDEVYVDDNDALYGKPSSVFRSKVMHRAVLSANFPKHADIIETATASEERTSGEIPTDMIEVWEAWHLPSGDKAKDGLHVIAIKEGILLKERYDGCFPFVVLKAKPRVVGFWGKGDAEALLGIQLELNRLIKSISEQLRRKGRGRIFVPIGSKVEPGHLTNGIADIVKYAGGVAPTVDNGSVVSADEFQQVDRLYERAFQEVGVSQLSAASKKPSGLDAAVALREFSEIESERFALRHLAWEQFFLDFAELAIELCEKRKSTGYKVKVPGKRKAEEVDFSTIDLDRDSYVVQMFPVSSLPQTPSARYQRVKEMLADGFVSPPVAKRLLDFPDLEAEGHLGNAALDDADATISKILDEDTPELQPLEPFQDFELIAERATAALLFARHNGCEQERLDMLQQLIEEATRKIAEMQAPPPPPGGVPGAPAMGPEAGMVPPGTPPVNIDLGGAGAPAPAVPPVVA